jgi:hypothetical protein
MVIGSGEKLTTLINLFSFYSPIPTTIKDLSQTKMTPLLVPVTAISELGMKTVLVYKDEALPGSLKSLLSTFGE